MKNLSHVFWTRIENRHGGGIPDLYGIKSWKKSAWLELKCIKQNSINLSPLQFHGIISIFDRALIIIILSEIRGQRLLKYITATKGEN